MTKTQENLLKAFAGESQARNRYTQFAKMARKQNFEWIARVFEETADQERTHAEEEYEMITEIVTVKDDLSIKPYSKETVSYTHLRAHETPEQHVCRLLLEKKKDTNNKNESPRLQ